MGNDVSAFSILPSASNLANTAAAYSTVVTTAQAATTLG